MHEPGCVIVSGDKDMLTLPGQHWRNDELITVSEMEANTAFYKQTLVGDTADNYPGCPGIGDKNKLLLAQGVANCHHREGAMGAGVASVPKGWIR